MAKYSNTVEYNIKTTLDASGVARLQTQLRQVEAELQRMHGRNVYTDGQVKKDLENINQIKTALKSAFNPNLGMLDTKSFMAGLTKGGKTLQDYVRTFNAAGTKGVQAFSTWYGQLGKIDTGLRQISKTGDKIMNTLGNTVRWGLIASGFSQMMNAVHQSVQYVKELDTSLTNIMMVSNETKENMNEFAKQANEVAQRLGGTTTQMTEATKVFVQQGMSLGQSSEMAEYAVHLANISEQDSTTTSDELTAMKNAFHLEIDDMGNAVSKWAAIANNAAVSMEELSVASQKAASVANTVGVDMDQFAGHIAAIEATTREAPENIGNGLKTLYSRISDIKLGETVEDGVDYGQFSSALKKVGVDVLDASGKMKDAGDIIEEIMAKWQDLDQTQRTAVATTVAGRFQLARFEALMNSQDIYRKSVDVARAESGTETYDRMQETYRNSLEGRSKALQASIEEVFLKAFNTESFYGLVDVTTKLVQVFGDLIEAVGGGGSAITAFGAILTKVMSNSIGRSMSNFVANRQRDKMVESNIETARLNAQTQLSGQGIQMKDVDAQRVINQTAQGAQYAHLMDQQQLDTFNKSLEQRTQILGALKQAEAEAAQGVKLFGTAFATAGVEMEAAEKGTLAFLEMLNEAGATIDKTVFETKEFSNTLKNLGNSQQGLTSLARAFEEVEKAQKGMSRLSYDEALIVAGEKAKSLSASLRLLARDTNLSTEAQQKFSRILKLSEVAENGNWNNLKKLQAAIKGNQLEINLYIEALNRLKNENVITSETYERMTGEVLRLREAFESTGMQAQIFNNQMANQSRMNGITETVSAIGQLAFTWQAFKSLGSLWANDDIEEGKKLEETILNLAMNIPMLIFGFNQLQTALGLPGLKTAITSLRGITTAMQQSSAASKTMTAMSAKQAMIQAQLNVLEQNRGANLGRIQVLENNLTMVKNANAAATKQQAAAELALAEARAAAGTVAMVGITAAIMIATMAWGKYTQNIKEAKEAEKSALDDAVAHTEEIKNATASWDELYKKYQETGEISQELVDAGSELGDSLDIIGAKALATADDFDVLNQRVQDAKDQGYRETILAAQRVLDGQYKDSLEGKELFNKSSVDDYIVAYNKAASISYTSTGKEIFSDVEMANFLNDYRAEEGDTYVETIYKAQGAVQALNEEIENLNNQKGTLDPEIWESRFEELDDARQEFNKYLNGDEVQAFISGQQEMYNARVQMSDFQEELDNAGTSAEKIVSIFANDPDTGAYFTNLTSDAERYVEALKHVEDESQRISLLTAYSEEEVKGLSEEQFNNFTADSIVSSDYEMGMIDFANKNNLTQDQITQLMVQSAIDQVNQNPELTPEEKEAILSSVDWSGSIEDILLTLARGSEDDTTAALAQYQGMTKEKAESGGDLSEEQLKEYNIDQETVDAYNEQLQSVGALAEQTEYYTDTLEQEKETLKELRKSGTATTEEIEEQEKAVEDAQEAFDDYNGETKDLTAKMIQTQKGLEKLGEEFENNSEILRDGEKNTLEYAEAMSETKDALGDVLNVDPGSLTNGFVEEHLEEIQRLADGDLTALDELRIAFGHDYIAQLRLEGDDEMNAALDQLEAQMENLNLQDIEVGAHIDDDDFAETLNQMMLDGQLTQDQVNEYLAGIGVEPQYETIPHPTTLFTTDGMSAEIDILGTRKTITLPHFAVNGIVEVPQIKTSKSKGSGGHTGLRRTGGASSGGLSNSYVPKSSSGGGGGGGSCFVAGTLVSTITGYKNIENIKPGNIVISYNEKEKINQYSIVLQTMIHDTTEELYTLYIENEKLIVTGIHRFLIVHHGKKEWIAAKDLQIGNLVLFADGTWHRISNITVEIKHAKVYNFEVSNNHNYYVGINRILAHNKGGGGGGGGSSKAEEPKEVARKKENEAEKDIYEKIDAWIEKLQDDYSKLKKAREKAWGDKNVVRNANKALGLLQAEHEALSDRIKISKEYQKALLGDANLKEKYNVKNSLDEYGLTDKDLDGVVDNYSEQWDIAKKLAEEAQKKADDYFKAHGGRFGEDRYGNTIITKDAEMLEAEANRYEELTQEAANAWEIVNQINDVTKEYEDTADKIRDDEEEQLDLLYEMDEIQIDLYERALDALDTLEEMHDLMAQMKGMWSGFELDSPFRAMVEDVQEIKDLFAGDTKKEINDYYNNIFDNIAKNNRLSNKQKEQARAFFEKEQKNATSANGYNNLGFGEMAAEARKLAELQAMETNTAVRNLVYGPTEEGYKQWKDALQEQAKKVEELALKAEEAWDKAQENIVDALDEELDKLDELYDKYDDIIDRVEREADRISLFHGEDQYDDLSKLADQAGKMQVEKAKKYQQEYNYWESRQNALKDAETRERNRRINEANQLIKNATNAQEKKEAQLALEQAKQYHSDEWEWYDEQMREAQKNVLEAQDEAAESFKKAYEYALDEIEAKFLESALGTRDTNYLEDDWNRDKDYMTTYKDDFERNYEVQKLNYKWQEMLNDALGSSLATQRKIRTEGQDIVDQLANQVTMSEYDVKLANAKLEVLQKQIALENAQQNKNQMKLRRDTQGNYKYVYAADQDDVGEKQQDLLDSIYDVWEISKEQRINSTDNYMEAVQQAAEKAKEIWNDASLNIEQKQALIAELWNDTSRLLSAISEDAADSFNGMISAVVFGSGIGLENVQEMCANVLEALETHNEEAIEAIGVPWDDELASKIEQIDDVKDAFTDAMDDCKDANQNFLDEIQGPNGVAAVTGEEYGKATTAINNAKRSTNDLYNETLKLYTLFGMESKALDEAKKTMEGYKKALDEATSGSGAFAKQIQAANQSIVDSAKASGNWITAAEAADKTATGVADQNAFSFSNVGVYYTPAATSGGGGGGGGGSAGGGGGGGGSAGGGGGGSTGSGMSKTSTPITKGNGGMTLWSLYWDSVKKFATGGYTGSWSDGGIDEKNGKLAVLHQKELVLNAADTKNILAAVELVRQSTSLLKSASLSDAIEKAGNSSSKQSKQNEAFVSQPVTISAEFPNANSVTEIKEALLSLTDAASQYAYRANNIKY